jgi:SAM-dependent methyltransferase
VESDGTFLDVGCANGQLLVDVVDWASEKAIEIVPYGLDLGPGLVGLARDRFDGRDHHFWVGDAWLWRPPRRWTYVYSLLDLSPKDLWCSWLHKLSRWVEPGGKLVIGSYGSRSRGIEPVDVAAVMVDCGLEPLGSSSGGVPAISRFAWCEPG